MELKTRYDLWRLLPQDGGKMVEVGVANGDFTFSMLYCWPGVGYMVDPWSEIDPTLEQENIPVNEQERRYQGVIKKAGEAQWGARARVMRQASRDACLAFNEGELDMVYLDGDHSLTGVSMDIDSWWPLIKSGGVLAGHDYLHGRHDGVMYGVKDAVDGFVRDMKLDLNIINDGNWPSWYCVKP